MSPLALDLNNNGHIDDIGLPNTTAYFDLTQDGVAEKCGWITPADGLLALDINGNGVIDDRGELFGTQGADNALQVLGNTADANHDGIVDSNDPLFSQLRVWQDINGDGISQVAELKTLGELSISAINLSGQLVSETTANGNRIIQTGSFVRDGQQQYMADIEFSYSPTFTDANPNRPLDQPPTLDSEVYQLPWLRGYGEVPSLHLAYQNDPALRQAARDLIASGWTGILNNFESFMAKWSGLEAAHLSYGVTRTNINTCDKVWMLETFLGLDVMKSVIEGGIQGILYGSLLMFTDHGGVLAGIRAISMGNGQVLYSGKQLVLPCKH